MEYRKTTILPTDEKKLAREMFNELVHEKPYILMVVLHKGEHAEKFVSRAAGLTGAENEPRWVVWARKVSHIEDIMRGFDGASKLPADLDEICGFSMSLGDEIRYVLKKKEQPPNILKILRAYAAAEGMA